MDREVARAGLALALALLLWAARPEARDPAPRWDPVPTGAAGLLFDKPIDVNRARTGDLEALPGIGPGRAAAIVATRRWARFCRVADLARVRGIGPRTLARIAPLLTVAGAPGCRRAIDRDAQHGVE